MHKHFEFDIYYLITFWKRPQADKFSLRPEFLQNNQNIYDLWLTEKNRWIPFSA